MARPNHLPEEAIPRSAVTVLELRDWLERRPREATTLSYEDLAILNEGMRFLRLAVAGEEMVRSSGASMVPRDERLSVYDETSRALGAARPDAGDQSGQSNLLGVSRDVLSQLLRGDPLTRLDPKDVEQAQFFFRAMEDYYFTGRGTQAEDLFFGQAESSEE